MLRLATRAPAAASAAARKKTAGSSSARSQAGRVSCVLLQEIPSLGIPGEVVAVKRGHFRNWLQPRGDAAFATPENLQRVGPADPDRIRERQAQKRREAAERRLGTIVVKFRRKWVERDQKMHGPVTAPDVCEKLLKQHGIRVEEKDVLLDNPILEYGSHSVPIKLKVGEVPVSLNIEKW